MLFQNDRRWRNIPLGRSSVTIGSHGCLITSLCNSYNIRRGQEILTPDIFNQKMIDMGGYTPGGLVIWSVAQKILNAEINSNYTQGMFNMDDYFYIVNYIFGGIGHFTNLIGFDGFDVNVFDVYDGDHKKIPRKEIRRVVSISYDNRG